MRRHLNEAQKAEIAKVLLEIEREKAKKRKISKLKQYQATDVRNLHTTEPNEVSWKAPLKKGGGINSTNSYMWRFL